MRTGDGEIVKVAVLGRNKVEFCCHALDQMVIRGISKEDVIKTLQHPTKVGLKVNPPLPFRRHVRRDFNANKTIDVVYEERLDCIVVVTAFPKLYTGKR